MTDAREREALQFFSALPLKERLFIRARLFSAPLLALVDRAPQGQIADVGCGHGLLAALLSVDDPKRKVIAIDPDQQKIAWARLGLGKLPSVTVRQGTVHDLSPQLDGQLDAVAVADVLYLLPVMEWEKFLAACRRLLKPRGLLLLKETEKRRSWKYYKCIAQELLMVRVLRKTKSSGGLSLQPRAFTEALLGGQGFALLEVADLSTGYTTPHLLFVAERLERATDPATLGVRGDGD
jgi:2-polyprenyl-6-hydroxyphenyl methylase/3-demethylubiquinone-9 3-methyltransferase